MANKEPGYVYILTNPSFREDWIKIGKSSRPVNVRSKELDNTAVPLHFDIYATMKTVKYNEAEGLVHGLMDQLTDKRIRKNREFFNLHPEEALKLFRRVASVIDDAEIEILADKTETKCAETSAREAKPIRHKKSKGHRPALDFMKMGMQKGDILVRQDDPSITVSVSTPRKVNYNGKEFALSLLTQKLKNSNYYVCAQPYWTYKGRLLKDIYDETYPAEK